MKRFGPIVHKLEIDSPVQHISPGSTFPVPNSEKSLWFSSVKVRLTHTGLTGLTGYELC